MNFLPSVNGFKFTNHWPHEALLSVNLPLIGRVNVGDACLGLCGGMTFAVLDHFREGLTPPAREDTPEDGGSLHDYIRRRQIESLSIPWGCLKVYHWTVASDDNVLDWTLTGELPRLLTALSSDPMPLTLIQTRSWNPGDDSKNHQVLAYAMEKNSDGTSVRIYDPNFPGDDDVRLLITPEGGIEHTTHSVRGFYLTDYSPKTPPT